jgi:hypothetical protein
LFSAIAGVSYFLLREKAERVAKLNGLQSCSWSENVSLCKKVTFVPDKLKEKQNRTFPDNKANYL